MEENKTDNSVGWAFLAGALIAGAACKLYYSAKIEVLKCKNDMLYRIAIAMVESDEKDELNEQLKNKSK